MKVIRFIFSLRFLLILFVLCIGLLLASNAIDFRVDPEDISQSFAGTGYEPQHHFMTMPGGRLHFLSIGDSSRQPVLLIHGSPGSWDNFVELVSKTNFLSHYYAIIPDRPGYGQSDLGAQHSLTAQAAVLKVLADSCFRLREGIILGHSYGAAVALLLASEEDSSTSGVVSLAGTVARPYQPRRWYNYVVKYSPVKYLIKDQLVTSNREMWKLTPALKLLEDSLQHFHGRAAFVSGGDDFLVDERSANYAMSRMDSATTKLFYKEDMNHFVIWNQKEYVMQALDWVMTGN